MHSGKKFTYGFLPTLFCLLAMLMTACGSGGGQTSTTKASANNQIFVNPEYGLSDIKTFDPGLSTDLPSITAIDMVFTGLVQLDDNLKVRDQLAASHSVAADGTTYTFKLKPDLKFSDGTPLTSKDVAYSIDRSLQPSLKSVVSPIYLALVKDSDKLNSGKIKTIINDSLLTPDDQTIVIKTSQKAAYFLQALTYSCSYVVEKSMIDKYGNNFADHLSEGIGGAGPFKVLRYERGKQIELVPNPNYYGPKPQLKKVVLPFIKDRDTSYKSYQANQVDTSVIPTAEQPAARNLPNNQFHQIPQLWINYYTMNYLTKPFDNIKIRQAFALAINKQQIAHNIYKDSVIATNHIVPKGMDGYNPDLTGPDGTTNLTGNQAKAKELLQEGMQEEGYKSMAQFPPITFTVATENGADARHQFEAVQQMWQNVLGVNVKINDEDFNKLLSDAPNTLNNPKGLQMWWLDWIADYPDAQDWLTLQFDKGVPNNDGNYGQNHSADAATQQQMQKLMEQADQNQDPAARIKQYNQVEQQLVNDVAWIPIDQVTYTYARKPCVAGVVDNAQDLTPPDDWAAVYKTTATPCASVTQYQS